MKSTICPVEQLEAFLNEQLALEQMCDIEQHLSECSQCRAALDRAAAEPQLWHALSGTLSEQLADRLATPLPVAGSDSTGVECAASARSALDGATATREAGLVAWNSLRSFVSPTDDPHSLGRIGQFEIIGVVGCGGMGIVLKAREAALERVVALKVLAPHLAAQPNARQRFAREAKSAASVKHAGIIAIHQVAEHRELPYLVMPYEAGPSLQQRLDRHGRLSIEEALEVAMQIADALAEAHACGLVHRDIKPSNILLAPGTQRALLTDFGLARACDDASLTYTGVLAGTPLYMSPEQARGQEVDGRTDLFSLGSVLFAMLTGAPPIAADSSYVVVRKIAETPMPKLRSALSDAPIWLERLVDSFHQPAVGERIASAVAAADLLRRCLQNVRLPQEYNVPSELQSPSPRLRLRLKIASGAAVIGVVLALIAYGSFGDWTEHDSHSEESSRNTQAEATVNRTHSQQTPDLVPWAIVDPAIEPRDNSPVAHVLPKSPVGVPWSASTDAPHQPQQDAWSDGLQPVIEHLKQRLSR